MQLDGAVPLYFAAGEARMAQRKWEAGSVTRRAGQASAAAAARANATIPLGSGNRIEPDPLTSAVGPQFLAGSPGAPPLDGERFCEGSGRIRSDGSPWSKDF